MHLELGFWLWGLGFRVRGLGFGVGVYRNRGPDLGIQGFMLDG